MCAACEITAGFLLPLFVLILPRYFFLRAIVYCKVHLPIHYAMPESAGYHKLVRALSHCSLCFGSAGLALVRFTM